jgi:2-polyprenyl-3-methyl-5-hydroxy-6-metoxy-1,4-benzoquinol methylase
MIFLLRHGLRAHFIEYVLDNDAAAKMTCLEPACGVGHMSKVLEQYFLEVYSADIAAYGYGRIHDF